MLQDLYHEPPIIPHLPGEIEVASDGNVVFHDAVRNKTLSVARHNLTFFSHQKNLTSKKWLEFASRLPSNLNSFMVQRDSTITNLSVNIQTYANSVLRIFVNDETTPIYTLNILNVKSIIKDGLNVDIDKSDILKCELEIMNGMIDFPIINLEHAWRY